MVERLPVKEWVVGSNPTTGAEDFILFNMFYVYIIQSLCHNTRYIGSTNDIAKRVGEHNLGKCRYTKGRRPWKLIHKEKYDTRSDVMKREKFLKSGQGRKYLNSVLYQTKY